MDLSTQGGAGVAEQQQDQAQPSLREQYADWPQKGGSDQPQPWDLEAHDLDPRSFPKSGARDDVSPVVVQHQRPILSAGSQGGDVVELCRLLAELGYDTSHSRGENHHNVFGESELGAVRKFRADYGVKEEPNDVFGGNNDDGRRAADRHVGPYTWEALYRVVARERG